MKKIKLSTAVFEYDPKMPLGRPGGFGQVFAGRTSAGEEIAVKKLHVSGNDVAHRELRIAEELRGRALEYVIPYLDSGEDADTGGYFVVMPRASHSLQEIIDGKAVMAPSDTAEVLVQIARGLQEVGELVHRDLKPDNVLHHDGRWKVADLGIARFVEEATASNTLKECLSPYYAAPEQWRLERATHATDVYALGCIGFCLLTGTPPFTKEPENQHVREPLPQFECADGRLRALINNMTRKAPETRPAWARVHAILDDITATPAASELAPVAILAGVGAEVAEREQRIQAKAAAERSAKEKRMSIAGAAFEILAENIERLWMKISAQAPNAERSGRGGGGIFECTLGPGSLAVNMSRTNYHPPGEFRESGWDVVASSQILVTQERPQYQWSATLWFMRRAESEEYRWHEVSYWTLAANNRFVPFAASGKDADYAASNMMHTVNIAFGPVAIDDEKEGEFHNRWIWLFALAAAGNLRRPSAMPIQNWPPQLL